MEGEKTHPCALSSEGVATEHYCRIRNRNQNDHLSACCKFKCNSPWRFCTACLLTRTSPMRTLKNGLACEVHGEVGKLSQKELLKFLEKKPQSQPVPEPQVQHEEKAPRAEEAMQRSEVKTAEDPHLKMRISEERTKTQEVRAQKSKLRAKRKTLRTYSKRLEIAIERNLVRKRKRLMILSFRLGDIRILRPHKVRLRELSRKLDRVYEKAIAKLIPGVPEKDYRAALLEDVVRDILRANPDGGPTLWEASEKVASRLRLQTNTMHVYFRKNLTWEEITEMGIITREEVKKEQAKRHLLAPYDYVRFEREFESACTEGLLRTYVPMPPDQVLERFRTISQNYPTEWDFFIHSMHVAHALRSMCADGRMSVKQAGEQFGKQEYWAQIALGLHKLIPVPRGLLGPDAPNEWRLRFGEAVFVSTKDPSKQLRYARQELWNRVKSRYKK